MKKIFLLFSFFLSGYIAWTQEQPQFPVDNILQGIDRHETAPVFYRHSNPKQLPDSIISACIADVNVDSITTYLKSLEDFGTRFMLAENHRDVAEWIKRKYVSMGYTNACLDSFQCITQWPPNTGPIDTSWQYNVFAALEGFDNPDIEVLIGGHYDAIVYSGGDPYFTAPGADDNGSAIAASLEIARVLKAHNIHPSTSITFAAWAGEERGLFGSVDKVIKALTNGEKIKTYINMDMIASDPGITNWEFNVNQYTGSEWLGVLVSEVAATYTSLNPLYNTGNSSSSDSYGFWLGGFPTVYFSEALISPNYHKTTDLVVNCNMPYCKEITKVALGTLLAADAIPSKVNYELFNPGTGNSLLPRWRPNPETNLTGYRVKVGYSSGNYHQILVTSDTSLALTGLSPDTLYYVAVSAVNTDGYEGPATEYADRPALVTMDQGVLIVDDSDGGILSPTDSAVDGFYRGVLENYQVTEYDAFMLQEIHLSDLGKYSSVLWHINRQTSITVLNRYLNEVINYLKLGGKIFFTLYQPEKAIYKISNYPNQWTDGTFLHDYLGIGMNDLNTQSFFNAGIPENAAIPLLHTDPEKTVESHNHHLNYIEALWPENNSNILYRYGTDYDTTTPQGEMHGMPVGLKFENQAQGWKTVILSFPLFYMDFNASKELTEYIMTDFFGETVIGIEDHTQSSARFNIVPNPANDKAQIKFTLDGPAQVSISVFNALGEKVKVTGNQYYSAGEHIKTVDLSNLPTGLYFVRLQEGTGVHLKKLMIVKPR